MFTPVFILEVVAAFLLLPALYNGAMQDMKEFKFSKEHFAAIWTRLAGVALLLAYLTMAANGDYRGIGLLVGISIIFTLIFSFFGFRYGEGGDWRAMIYIAWVAPFMMLGIIFWTCIWGIVQSIHAATKSDGGTPALFRKIPFAVSIFLGYLTALFFFIIFPWSRYF